ncbi:hypothetical protein ACIQ4I_09850 [Rummeliibacillus sp. NPDC094406]|uniref:hypothetical protein n=1 Tax=Rummeliibacillus sp. NPDC094406 TaxID=3364511 RepID=UPI003823D6C3
MKLWHSIFIKLGYVKSLCCEEVVTHLSDDWSNETTESCLHEAVAHEQFGGMGADSSQKQQYRLTEPLS